MKQFFKNVEELMYYFRTYGYEQYLKNGHSMDNINYNELLRTTYDGYKILQDKVIEYLKVEKQIEKDLDQNYIECRKVKDKIKLTKMRMEIDLNRIRIKVYRHFIDSIIWVIFAGRRELIARFTTESDTNFNLDDAGFLSSLEYVQDINKNPLRIAILTDISINVHIGDILIISDKEMQIVEMKSGKQNMIAQELFNFYEVNELDPKTRIANIDDKKFKSQMERMLNQDEKVSKLVNLLEKGKGKHPKNENLTVTIHDSFYQEETFHNIILKLYSESKDKKWAYDCIEGMVHIGVYRKDWRFKKGFETLTKANNNYQVYDIRKCMDMLAEPLFCKPFPDEMIMDILTGEIIILLGIDYDAFIHWYNEFSDTPLRWSTRKELSKIRDDKTIDTSGIVIRDNQTIIYQLTDNLTGFIGYSLVFRILLDHNKPLIQILNRVIVDNKRVNDESINTPTPDD